VCKHVYQALFLLTSNLRSEREKLMLKLKMLWNRLQRNWLPILVVVLLVAVTGSVWKTHHVHVERGLYDCDTSYHNH
jgi:hypothetical protein